MLHLLLYGVLAIALAGGLFALAARFLPAGEQIAPPVRDEPPWELPDDRALTPEEIDSVRLPVALRGYRFAETDTLLDRLASELRARDEEIARLRDRAQPPAEPAQPAEEPAEEPAEPAEEPAAVDAAPAASDGGYWAVNTPPWAVTAEAAQQASGGSDAPPQQRRRRRK